MTTEGKLINFFKVLVAYGAGVLVYHLCSTGTSLGYTGAALVIAASAVVWFTPISN